MRAEFTVADPLAVNVLTLQLRYDDGFIAWLNGTEVSRANVSSTYPAWSATATSTHQASTTALDILDLSNFASALHAGTNVLAIRGLNADIADDDALIQFTLTGESRTGPPLARDDAASTTENQPVTIDVLEIDDEGIAPIAPGTVSVATPAAHGTALVNADGTITYTPATTFNGLDTFSYTVRDNSPTGVPFTQTLVASNAEVKAMVPPNDSFGTTWRGGNEPFNDSSWSIGAYGVGYDTNTANIDFNPMIGLNVGTAMQNVNTTVYMRSTFSIANPADVTALTLRMRYDDGFAAFINGVQVASAYAPVNLSFNSTTSDGSNGDNNAILFQTFNVSPFISALLPGTNVLAIHGLNLTAGSSDLLMQPELTATGHAQGRVSNAATVTVDVTGVEFAPIARDDAYSIDEGQTLSTSSVNYSATILASNPVAYWRLDDTSTAVGGVIDAASDVAPPQSGSQNGTFNGFNPANFGLPGPRSTDHVGGQPLLGFEADNRAPSFQGDADGGDDVLLIPDVAPLNFATNRRFTLEAWVNGAATQEVGAPIISRGYGWNEQFTIDIYDNGYRFFVRNTAGTPTILQGTVGPNNTWQHVVATFDQNQGIMRLYVNAVEVGAALPPATLNNPAHDVSIGSRQSGPGASYDHNFAGRIDEVAGYDRALTAAEIQAHYNAALGTRTNATSAGILGNDTEPDGQTMIAVLGTAPANGTLDFGIDGTFEYVPNLGFAGIDTFTYRASDGTLLSDPATVTITVRHSPPTALPNAYETDEDTPLVVSMGAGLLANDIDSQSHVLTASVALQPTHGTLALNPNGSFTYTPAPNYSGLDSYTYQASDGTLQSAVATVSILVHPVDDAPVAVDDAYSIDEGQPVEGASLPAGAMVWPTQDGGNGHAYLRVSVPATLDWTSARSAAELLGGHLATITSHTEANFINASSPGNGGGWVGGYQDRTAPDFSEPSGGWRWITGEAWGYTTWGPGEPNESGSILEDFLVVGSDGTSWNDHPDWIGYIPGFYVEFPASANVLANDMDADGDSLTAMLVTGPTNGTLVIDVDGTFMYTSNLGFVGVDTFTYRANDGTSDSNVATVTITVRDVNAVPQAASDSYAVDEDGTLVVDAAAGVLANDVDAEGEPLSASMANPPSIGTLTLAADGSFVYTPHANFFGTDTFTYRATDGENYSPFTTVTITIYPLPDVPVAVNDLYSTAAGQVLDVTASPSSVNVTLIPAGAVWNYLDDGSDQGSAWREATFSDTAWDSGPAELGYGDGNEATAVDCGPAPGNECMAGGGNPSNKYITTYFRRAFTIEDPARVTSLSLNLNRDDGAAVYLNGVEVVRDNLPSGTITFDTLAPDIAQDDGTNFNPFANINRIPLVRGQNVIAVEIHQQSRTSSDISFDLELTATVQVIRGVLANDTDADGDALAATSVAGPYHGALDFRSDGTFTFTPAAGFTGVDQFTYRATDGQLFSEPATVRIVVSPPGKPPEDLNADGIIDAGDLAFLLTSFGKPAGAKVIEGDLNGDGRLGVQDAIALRNAFASPPSPAAAMVKRANDRAIVASPSDSDVLRASRRTRQPNSDTSWSTPTATDEVFATLAEGLLTGRRWRLLGRRRG